MSIHTIFYYPILYGENYARDESLPLADKILSIRRESVGEGFYIDCTIYRWDRIFIVKHEVYHSLFWTGKKDLFFDKESLFLTVLRSNDKLLAIVDWVDLTRMSVFILPSYFLNEYIESLVRRGGLVFLPYEDEIRKIKRRFGFDFPYLKNVFKDEWEKIEKLEKLKTSDKKQLNVVKSEELWKN
jgi:hypothetical protein